MRTIALAQAARRRQLDVRFVTRTALAAELADEHGFETERTADEGRWIAELGPRDLVTLDGYDLDDELAEAIMRRGCRVGRVDDSRGGRHHAHVILNPSTAAADYDLPPDGVQLLGPRHALIREEFAAHRASPDLAPPRELRRLVITLGGADVAGLTLPIAQTVAERHPTIELVVLVGPAARVPADVPGEVVRAPTGVAALLATADAAIAAAGGTSWELAYLGVPAAFVATAENQQVVLESIRTHGVGLVLGDAAGALGRLPESVGALRSRETRRQLRSRALATVDGRGADRFVDALVG